MVEPIGLQNGKTENQGSISNPSTLTMQLLRENPYQPDSVRCAVPASIHPCGVLGPESVTTDTKLLISLARVSDDPTTIHGRREMREHR